MEVGQIVERGAPGDLIGTDSRFAALAALDEAGWDWASAPAQQTARTISELLNG